MCERNNSKSFQSDFYQILWVDTSLYTEDNSVITVSVFAWQIIWCLAVFIDVLVSVCFCSTGCHVTQIMLIRVILQPCVYFTTLSFCHQQNIFKESCQGNKIKLHEWPPVKSAPGWVVAQYMCFVAVLCYCCEYCYMLLDYTFTSVTFYVYCASIVDSNCGFVVSLLR